MTATLPRHCTNPGGTLYPAFQLGWAQWNLAFTSSPACLRTIPVDRPRPARTTSRTA